MGRRQLALGTRTWDFPVSLWKQMEVAKDKQIKNKEIFFLWKDSSGKVGQHKRISCPLGRYSPAPDLCSPRPLLFTIRRSSFPGFLEGQDKEEERTTWRRSGCSKEGGQWGDWDPRCGQPKVPALSFGYIYVTPPRCHRENSRLRPACRATDPGHHLIWSFGLSGQ